MKTINVFNMIGSDAFVDAKDGIRVREAIVRAAEHGNVEVSFKNIRICLLHPLHLCIGTMFAPERIHLVQKIKIVDIEDYIRDLVNRVAENAKTFYNVTVVPGFDEENKRVDNSNNTSTDKG